MDLTYAEFRLLMPVEFLAFMSTIALLSTIGLFSSNETLELYSRQIGSNRPFRARIICFFGVLIGWTFIAGEIADHFGWL